MNTSPGSMLLLGLGLTLFLAAVSVFAFPGPASADGTNRLTRFFLVALRLSIGWHFFVEGMDKLNSPNWSSEPYLREASGPLAPFFRELAGDRLVDKVTLGAGDAFPHELDIEWKAYLSAFTSFYGLDAEQAKDAAAVLEDAEAKTKVWLKTAKKPVTTPSEYPPPNIVPMTMAERIEKVHALEAAVDEVEEVRLPRYGPDAFPKLKIAKANLAKWRAELKADLDQKTLEYKQALRDQVLIRIARSSLPVDFQAQINPKDASAAQLATLRTIYSQVQLKKATGADIPLTPQAIKVFDNVIAKKQDKQDPNELLPKPPGRPVQAWSMLDWSDFIVKWGILVTGACLLLGLLTRTACLAGAGLLLMFFLAMPPLPGWPESPRAEGHYLFINKNIIEMFALLTLCTTRSGRWAGLDGLLQFLRAERLPAAPPSGTVERVLKLDEEPTLALNAPEQKDA